MRKRKIKGNTLPEFLKKYFWEVDFKEIDLRKHSTYILIRLMEYGDEKAVKWIKKHFTGEDIANVLFHFQVDEISWGTVSGFLEGVRFELFFYKYPVIFPFKSLNNINILDLRDIAAIKIDTIASRGKKRNFIDLYFICKGIITLGEALSFYEQKFGEISSNIIHIQKSLVYFTDADSEKMPKMIKDTAWEDVKKFFIEEVKKLNNKL